eukprot:2361554-Prymnesium_polylepis.2
MRPTTPLPVYRARAVSAHLVPWVDVMMLDSDRPCQCAYVANGGGVRVEAREAKHRREIRTDAVVLESAF